MHHTNCQNQPASIQTHNKWMIFYRRFTAEVHYHTLQKIYNLLITPPAVFKIGSFCLADKLYIYQRYAHYYDFDFWWFLCKKIPALELSLFMQNIAYRVPNSSVYRSCLSIQGWLMVHVTVHSNENTVICHIDSFSLV